MSRKIVTLCILGFIQFFTALFISRYFEFVYSPFYNLLVLFGIQTLSLWTNLWQPQLTRFRHLLYPAYVLSIFSLSLASLGTNIFLLAAACLLMFSLVQSEIIDLLKQNSSRLGQFYGAELFGGILGILCWYWGSAFLGFQGFFYLCLIAISLVLLLKNVHWFEVIPTLFLGLTFCLLVREPQPIINKRDRLALLEIGSLEKTVWDPNGHVELISFPSWDGKIISFEGGTLRSHIYKFDGNYDRLKRDYLNSIATGAWGLDVVLPHFMQEHKSAKVALISTVGGQEILAARAFGASKIYAIDINKSAQKIVAIDNSDFSGNIYSPPVLRITEDGRHFIEQSDENFDVIQIYSADSASLSSALGAFFRPSSLITKEALNIYNNHLTSDGILQITQHPFVKLKSTFEAAFGEDIFKHSKNIFAFKRKTDDNLVTISYKKDGWRPEEIAKMMAWLQKDPSLVWQVIINPYSPLEENIKQIADLTPQSAFIKPSTDNWPFFQISRSPLKTTRLQNILYVGGLILLLLAGSIMSQKKYLNPQVAVNSFTMGLTYAVAQSLFIFNFQKIFGMPDLGLSLAMSWVLLLSASSAILYKPKLVELVSTSKSFVILAGVLILTCSVSAPHGLLALSVLVFAQGLLFIRILQTDRAIINYVLWMNGLGFALGVIIFNIIFVLFGLIEVIIFLSLLYFGVATRATMKKM